MKFASLLRKPIECIKLVLAGGLVENDVKRKCLKDNLPLIEPDGGRYMFREVILILIIVSDFFRPY